MRNPKIRLGAGSDDAQPIKDHPFFKKIDWEKLEARELTPPFKPKIKTESDVKNFDKEYTNEDVVDTPIDVNVLPGDSSENHFERFTYNPD